MTHDRDCIYTVHHILQILEKFAESHEDQSAKIMMLLPDGRNPLQKDFNIREIKLVENKLIGLAYDKYRLMVLVE